MGQIKGKRSTVRTRDNTRASLRVGILSLVHRSSETVNAREVALQVFQVNTGRDFFVSNSTQP